MTAHDIRAVAFLKGPRIRLRPPFAADLPRFLRWMNDEAVNQYLLRFLPVTELAEREWLEGLEKRKHTDLVLAIVEAKRGAPIGVIGLHGLNWQSGTATTGAVIGEKRYWGKGYGTEAKMLLLRYAFLELNLRKICSRVLASNPRSQAYNRKCGYKVEGVLRAQTYRNGKFVDEVQMAVFKEDWLPLWEKFRKEKQ